MWQEGGRMWHCWRRARMRRPCYICSCGSRRAGLSKCERVSGRGRLAWRSRCIQGALLQSTRCPQPRPSQLHRYIGPRTAKSPFPDRPAGPSLPDGKRVD
jgi:hypothetical protein